MLDGKYDLRNAQDDFNLWDGVHGRDVLKQLEQGSKWEPGKKERERRERLAFQEAQQKLAEANGEGLDGKHFK